MASNPSDSEVAAAAPAPAAEAAPATPAEPQLSIPEQIEKLDQLRRQGVVTDEEFEAKKRELLDRM